MDLKSGRIFLKTEISGSFWRRPFKVKMWKYDTDKSTRDTLHSDHSYRKWDCLGDSELIRNLKKIRNASPAHHPAQVEKWTEKRGLMVFSI